MAAALAMLVAAGCGSSKGPYDTDPAEPGHALETLQVADGFHVELMAAEPLIADPVEMAFDENGRIYVAEMLDYPFDPPAGQEPKSRISVLEDTNGDGKPDKKTVFATELKQVTSVFPWKGGIFATAAPDILYLKDTDGDRRADFKEVWYTGFDDHVSSESRITNLRFNVDNWVYAANNGRPGTIRSPKFPKKPPVVVRGFDFRFHPVTGDFEPASGPTQFGMSFNDWGDRFVSQNTVHLRHAVLPAKYVLRNRFFAPPSMLQYMSGDDPSFSIVYPLTKPQEWRVERTKIRQERYNETNPGRVEHVGGHFTAATGATVYTGDALPDWVRGNVFVGDANGNLVHLDKLTQAGATYRAEGWPQGREFLASTDVWFRPVNFANAPDGTLWIMDFYREYIEEPASIPEAIKKRLKLDFYRGTDRGRLYRIVPAKGEIPKRSGAELGKASPAQLVEFLKAKNGWHRLTAQRLLLEKQDQSVVPALRQLYTMSEEPQARLSALRTIEGLGAVQPADVQKALADPFPAVRIHALEMAERFLPQLTAAVRSRMDDPDTKVQFQLSLTLGQIPESHRELARLLGRYPEDPWFQAAVLTSSSGQSLSLLKDILAGNRPFFATPSQAKTDFVARLGSAAGARRDSPEIAGLVEQIAANPLLRDPQWREAGLRGLAAGLAVQGTRGLSPGSADKALARLVSDPADGVSSAAIEAAQYFHLPALTKQALADARNPALAIPARVRAVRLLKAGDYRETRPVLETLLKGPEPKEVHTAAAQTVSAFSDPSVAGILLGGWAGYHPETRTAVVDAMIRQGDRAKALLDAVEQGQIKPKTLDPVARIRLSQFPDPAIQAKAKALLKDSVSARAEVVKQYQDVLGLPADAARGKPVFEEHCARCHLRQQGRDRIGPDLSGVNNKSKEELLTHILDPSFEIEPNYTNYIAVDKQGRIYDGLLAGETSAAVTLRGGLEDVTILRANIAEMRVAEVSMMPNGLEEEMSKQQIADLIAYLRAGL